MERVKALECGVSYCPISTAIIGPFMAAPIREYLRRVGLGTDNGGGFSSSILDVRLAFVTSNARQEMSNGQDPVLTIQEIFFLATLGVGHIGSFILCHGLLALKLENRD
jgi:guanine deaminase